ncbi:MAG: glycosyltransferase family 2 protein [Nitrososphaerota archaeon]|nr:glycosyltransferase family 2 protein [Nitrososphaerota archaeon]
MLDSEITVCICTYNSARTLSDCMSRLRLALPRARVLVVDHHSQDGTYEIAKMFGAELYSEREGLGAARQMCFDLTSTRLISFLDSDVILTDSRFFYVASSLLNNASVGAVVGMSVGHRLAYGLPAGLLVLRTRDFRGQIIPPEIDARETYYIQRRLTKLRLKTRYLANCMIHKSGYRELKPEWEGANTRLIRGLSPAELIYAFRIIVLLTFNNRSLKNILYVPIFYAKFMRGFLDFRTWRHIQRAPVVDLT